jgi:hypothetical protein
MELNNCEFREKKWPSGSHADGREWRLSFPHLLSDLGETRSKHPV